MEKTSAVRKYDILPEFQKFLLDKKMAPEKHVPFYAIWASKYFHFVRKKQISSAQYQENAFIEFIETLKSDANMSDWQIRQAHDDVKLYYFHYLGHKPAHDKTEDVRDFSSELLKEAKRLIRLKHYSFSTERTYLQWIQRFLQYAIHTGKKGTAAALGAGDCKNFLSHLALKEKVASSTQNQAFNALLFLFRNVLGKDIGDLSNTVRAKRGQRLPVVFSVDEVKQLLACLSLL